MFSYLITVHHITVCVLLIHTHADRPRYDMLMMLATSYAYKAIG